MKMITKIAVMTATVLGTAAQAETVTFGAGTFSAFSGSAVEGSFTYSEISGALFHGTEGSPGGDMEGFGGASGGVLGFTSSNGLFTFEGLDYAASSTLGSGTQTLLVSGYLSGSLVGTDSFELANTAGYSVGSPYSNWTSFNALVLAGITLDNLQITLNGAPEPYSFQAVDNVRFGAPSVPEPASWAMMIAGFGIAGTVLRHRRGAMRFA